MIWPSVTVYTLNGRDATCVAIKSTARQYAGIERTVLELTVTSLPLKKPDKLCHKDQSFAGPIFETIDLNCFAVRVIKFSTLQICRYYLAW